MSSVAATDGSSVASFSVPVEKEWKAVVHARKELGGQQHEVRSQLTGLWQQNIDKPTDMRVTEYWRDEYYEGNAVVKSVTRKVIGKPVAAYLTKKPAMAPTKLKKKPATNGAQKTKTAQKKPAKK